MLAAAYRIASRIRRAVFPGRADRLNQRSLARRILGNQRLVAVDVGAAQGLLPHWESLDGIALIYQIEPREDACRTLEVRNAAREDPGLYRVVCAAVSGTDGPRVLYVSNAPTGTSLLKTDPKSVPDCADYVDLNYLYPMSEQQIETRSLATLLRERGETQLDLIKLDIQGAELEVLRGLGPDLVAGVLGVELEIGMHTFYPEETRFCAVEAFMQSAGLELFDLRVARVHRPKDSQFDYYQRKVFGVYENSPTISARIWEVDAIYFRRRSALLAERDASTLRRMMLSYCTYNFFSEAYNLVEKAEELGIFSTDEARVLRQLVVDLHHVRHFRPWLADTSLCAWLRRKAYAVAPRSAPRWCQYMYQNYPNG
jgi:FkbM family methyltransferase